LLWIGDERGYQEYRGYGRLRFLNHSIRANNEFRRLATRTIRRGQEITFHYGEEWEHVA